jgi:uncharacterized protein (TIGR00661 family)
MDHQNSSVKPTILVAPLDWGLGHATRCIPIISALIHQNCNVLLAGEGRIKALLQQEFPHVSFLDLKGYQISYSKSKWTLPFTITTQIPKILAAVNYEHEWLEKTVLEYSIDAVISDNRYGLYHPQVPSIIITHQLLIKTPFGKQVDKYLQQLNYEYITQFTECWIPDAEGSVNLAGELSHPLKEPSIVTKYIGPLSRFNSDNEPKEEKHLLILLSGPEPQRTVLEELLLEQLVDYSGPVCLVRGLPGDNTYLTVTNNISVFSHLSADELKQKILQASFVIGRCGYSTIMDLAILKKKGILIPTPGQTEQEYLAKHLMKMNFALCIEQGKFRLKNALQLASSFRYVLPVFAHDNELGHAVHSLVLRLSET